MDAAKIVAAYIKMRDAKGALEAQIKDIESQMAILSGELLEICKATGQEGGKTEFGTFTRSVKTRYWTNNWAGMYEFIRERNLPELLEKRIHQTNMREWMEQNPDILPTGLNTNSEYTVTVRRSS